MPRFTKVSVTVGDKKCRYVDLLLPKPARKSSQMGVQIIIHPYALIWMKWKIGCWESKKKYIEGMGIEIISISYR